MRRAQITVFFSLMLPLLLALLGTVLESAYQQAVRSQVQRNLVLCEYSFLSEYQKELWEQYGLFFLDTGYGTQEEDTEEIKARLLSYLRQNTSWEDEKRENAFVPFQTMVSNIETRNFSRMTDDEGMVFYEQAVAFEQNLWGADVLPDWLGSQENVQNAQELAQSYADAEARERQNLEIQKQRRLEEEEQETADPTEGLQQKAADRLLSMVIAAPEQISAKFISQKNIPSVRTLLKGGGSQGRYPGNAVNDQWFYTYLLERFINAKDVLSQEQEAGEWLAYEMEYILAGKSSDRENLKAVANRLLLLREGMNYAYLLTDEGKKQEAYAWAAVAAGVTGMPELIDALQQVILLSWAYGESVLDVRALLQGNKVDFIKTQQSWRLPLSQLLSLEAHLTAYDGRTDEAGIDYEGYLRMLLVLLGRQEKCMRSLDVIEGNLRTTEMDGAIYVDQCIDGLTVQADFQYKPFFSVILGGETVQERMFTATRRVSYDW